MSALTLTVTVAVVFGAIALWRGVIEAWQLPYSYTARQTLRLAVTMCSMATVTALLLFVGVVWLVAMPIGAVVGVVVFKWLIRQMEYVSK